MRDLTTGPVGKVRFVQKEHVNHGFPRISQMTFVPDYARQDSPFSAPKGPRSARARQQRATIGQAARHVGFSGYSGFLVCKVFRVKGFQGTQGEGFFSVCKYG